MSKNLQESSKIELLDQGHITEVKGELALLKADFSQTGKRERKLAS